MWRSVEVNLDAVADGEFDLVADAAVCSHAEGPGYRLSIDDRVSIAVVHGVVGGEIERVRHALARVEADVILCRILWRRSDDFTDESGRVPVLIDDAEYRADKMSFPSHRWCRVLG